ncbi:hypothetical protein DNU06_05690 [Putridiphycobacter roseus]|uniref:Secretion system C-terminal sorting domain-containing protein n=1 Tax=Putridiphycobacter roseus TaxID=2219161 RepID=A0A2W1NTQ1_9FLAO|nr:T9SS type A sorting domain-containing protein [Putridiphycobacter roseus]PZE18108.1 hypothetical protein DNU06_05690 [Putridiphycobacter roseus]
MRLFVFFAMLLANFQVIGQCSATVVSSNGYTVTIDIDLVSIAAPSNCPNGYNYNVNLNYNIVFSGTNIPSNLYTLQGNVSCGGANTFYNLPNSGGTGSTTTTGNQYTNATDCTTATPASLNCYTLTLQIGGPGLSNQTVNMNCTTLPVELLSFKAYQLENEVELDWKTASETNSDYFMVKHSLNGLDWHEIGQVKGAGNATLPIDYTYMHKTPSEGLSYYRLQQFDFDGAFENLPIVSVFYRKVNSNGKINLYPNPSTINSINLEGLQEELTGFKILNVLSSDVTHLVVVEKINDSKYKVDLGNLSKGVYFVKTKSLTLKFVNL